MYRKHKSQVGSTSNAYLRDESREGSHDMFVVHLRTDIVTAIDTQISVYMEVSLKVNIAF